MARSHRPADESHPQVPSRPRGNPLHPRTFWALLRKSISKWNDDPTLRFGAGLSYYTAFAVVPLVFIVIELAGDTEADRDIRHCAVNGIGEGMPRKCTDRSEAQYTAGCHEASLHYGMQG